ncbi:hypothetical protein Acsp06_32300 [Actinomycetospora sp. NBRC 106375]|uniref:hypothetical protein n=1 Tax=Actinomycetospora sp. NBRC 106375 TaxID=3032207 RepID=UPI0024A42C29|nr:hypothetical protein [Actinomycetospora sp. NBRC 106375]GLZ47045.1 hypothetical protein Acsp06_32300 [Actinomycetospora sp. NBRC 106375]
MAGRRSEQTDPLATADQPPTEGEPAYEPEVEPGGDVPGAVLGSDHEEPIDGPEPDA